VIKNLNTIIEETRSRKRKNKRRSKEMDRIVKAMNQAKKKVMVHRKMLPGLKKSNKRKRNSSKMTKENS
jgi:glycerol-3-phosphate responsive antiterminator